MAQPEPQVVGGILESTDADRRALLAQSAPSINENPTDGLYGTKEGPGFGTMFANGWSRYTSQGQAVMAAAAVHSLDEVDSWDPAYDPYEFYAQHKDEYKDLEDSLVAGHFDEIRSDTGFRRRAQMLRENAMLDKDIAEGGTVGLLVGLGASLFDVTNFVGAGFLTGARAATRIGRAAQGLKVGAGAGAIGAIALNAMDPTRDWKDAVLDIGLGATVGGTIGSFTRHLPPDSPLFPGHPDNPLRADAPSGDPVHIVKPGQLEAEGETIHSSGGAAAVSKETRDAFEAAVDAEGTLPAQPKGMVGKAVMGVSDAATGLVHKVGTLMEGTVFSRMPHYPAHLRGLLTRGLDHFGFLNRAMARGEAAAPEAESIKNLWRQKGSALQEDLKHHLRTAQIALGESKWAARAKGALDDLTNGKIQTNRITREEFFGEVVAEMRSKMTNHVNAAQEIRGRLKTPGRSDEQVEAIYAEVRQAAEASKRHMDEMFHRADDIGLMGDKVDLKARITDAEQRLAALHAKVNQGDHTQADALTATRQELKDLIRQQQDYDATRARKDQGDAYGLPIMFVRGQIMRDRKGFENLLMRVASETPDEKWLKEAGHVWDPVPATATAPAKTGRTVKELQDDPVLWNQALKEWNGEVEHNLREQAATAWTAAEKRLNDALNDVENWEDTLGYWEKDKKRKTAASARNKARRAEAGWQARNLGYAQGRAERAQARLEAAARDYPDLLDLGEHATRKFEATGAEVDAALEGAQAAKAQVSEVKATIEALRMERSGPVDPETGRRPGKMRPGSPEYVAKMAEIDEMIQERVAANAYLAEAEQRLSAAASKQRDAAAFRDSVIKELERFKRDKRLVDTAEGVEEMLRQQRARVDKLQEAVANAEVARKESINVWKSVRGATSLSRKEARAAMREHRKTGLVVKTLGKRTPKAEWAEKLASHLSGLNHYPGGMLLDEMPEIGRLKERRLKWDEATLKEAMDSGFVESDLSYIMDRYTRDMGGRIAVHEAFDGRSYAKIAEEADAELLKWVESAQDPKERAARQAMHERGLKDLDHMWKQITGQTSVEDTDMLSFGVKTLMNGAYLRIAGGIWKAAVQDVGTAVLQNPRIVSQMLFNGRAYARLLKEMDALAKTGDEAGRLEGLRQVKVLMASMENVAHTGISQRAVGRGSALTNFGYGDEGTLTRSMTRQLEVGMQNLGDKVTWATGLNLISDFVRRNAAFAHIADMAEFSKQPWDKLSASRKARLASMNIGAQEYAGIAAQMKAHGTWHGKLFDPGIDKWDNPRLVDAFENSVVKAQNRSAYTESIGAVPVNIHDGTIYHKALQQFQSHAHMTLEFFIRTGIQRGAVTGDYFSGMAALAISTSLGVFMSVLRAYENGQLDQKLRDWDSAPSTLVREVIDRSGITGAAAPYFDAVSKSGIGNHLNKMLGTKFFAPSTRFSQSQGLTGLLGPAFGTAQNIYQGVSNVIDGQLDKAQEKFMRLLPMNQQIRLFTEIANASN